MSDYTFSNKDFLNPIITALKELGGSAHISEIEEQIIKELNLTEKQINKIHNGNRTKLNYDLAWARTYLKIWINYKFFDWCLDFNWKRSRNYWVR